MKRLNVLYFIVMILLLALPAVSMPLFTNADSTENRELSPFPQLRKADGSLNTGYMEEFDLWIDDHIGFRTVLCDRRIGRLAVLRGYRGGLSECCDLKQTKYPKYGPYAGNDAELYGKTGRFLCFYRCS